MYKPLRVYKCIHVEGECARPCAHMTARRQNTSGLILTYFFFGAATLANLAFRFLAS